jgi:hypothetical protein
MITWFADFESDYEEGGPSETWSSPTGTVPVGGPLVYVAGTFPKWTSLTQTFLLSRGRSPHYFSSNSCQKSGCLGTYF